MIQERVAVLGEVPELVDFLFLDGAPGRSRELAEGVAGDEGRRRILAEALAAYETCPWDVDALHAVTLADRGGVGRKLGKAQAPIRVAVMGRTRGLPSSTRWPCSAGTRRDAGSLPPSARLAAQH